MKNFNTTVNGTQPAMNCYTANTVAVKIGQTFAYCVLFVISLIGNFLIGIILVRTKNMRKTINYLIANMAISDILFPIFVFPRLVTELYAPDSGLVSGSLGEFLCDLVFILQLVSMTVSIQSLVLISVDRFGAVVFPLRSPLISTKRCFFLIFATWFVAISLHLPYSFAFKVIKYTPGHLACQKVWNEEADEKSFSDENYFLALSIILFLIPFSLMIILYSIIIYKLKSQKIPGEQSVNAMQRSKRQRKVLQVAIAIVLGFGTCWTPFNILAYVNIFAWDNTRRFSCGMEIYWFIVLITARANCAVNPCICFLFSGNYRQGLKRLLA